MSAQRRLRAITSHLVESSSVNAQKTFAESGKVIVVGGGLAGLSAAHTVLERGGRVLLLDKNSFMGGNSTKATSGINGALSRAQVKLGIQDSVIAFEEDTALSATQGQSKEIHPLGEVLVGDSASAIEWLTSKFGLDLSKVSRLGGHSFPRTHRGKEKFPGMTITYALMDKLEKLAVSEPENVKILVKARVTKLLTDSSNNVTGCEYVYEGKTYTENGPVVLCTGGYAADFTPGGLLDEFRPEWKHLPTTNGEHCTGDGIKMVRSIHGGTVDLKAVQVHPTGLVHPDDPESKIKFLAAEALRGVGGLMVDREGRRFCNELGRRDYCTQSMWKHDKAPYYLVLNSAASSQIEWHCKHYSGRGLMRFYKSGEEFCKAAKIDGKVLEATFNKYNEGAKNNNDEYAKKFFDGAPFSMKDSFYVSIITPVLHYTMGGIRINTDGSVQKEGSSDPIPGLFAGGEVAGGVHGLNRLGGSSLLGCVVFGRVCGNSAAQYLLRTSLQHGTGPSSSGVPQTVSVQVLPDQKRVHVDIKWDGANASSTTSAAPVAKATSSEAPKAEAAAPQASSGTKEYTLADVAKHNKDNDCWVVVNGQVLDVTSFLDDHPGGKKAILLYAGRDATEEFNMLHEKTVVEKYAPSSIIGNLKN
eukprot:TRINITY_DN11335_c0_g1_i1.p1 TRINITY_DN11335_c0_g1~~TRINITY_DN11335_c0_g1_i1.p1  ORF type:complete len:642 (+),score=203.05 TRINITY_DN11335_c0_g1_i1:42-1967(+)